jgi:hypothetical protein
MEEVDEDGRSNSTLTRSLIESRAAAEYRLGFDSNLGKGHEASRTDSPVRGPANIEKEIPSPLTEVPALKSSPPLGQTDKGAL